MNNEIKQLEKEEESLYNKLLEYVSLTSNAEQRKFCKLLRNYVDINIEIEKECNK